MANSGDEARVAVVGGGIAGLATAYYLGCAGHPVDLFEAEAEVGGLARSFRLGDLTTERYYHYLCAGDRELVELGGELGLNSSLVWRPTATQFFCRGRHYPFTSPWDLLRFDQLKLTDRLALGLEALRWRWLGDWKGLDDQSARDWILSSLGQECWDLIFYPLLAMKFGRHHDRISAAWLWHRLWRVSRSRRGLVGPQEMGYFRGGTAALLERLVARIEGRGGRVFLNAPVEAVLADCSGQVGGLRVGGEDRRYGAVVLAVPLPQAGPLLPAGLAAFRAELDRIPFIGVACLVAQLTCSLSDAFWCNVSDPRLPFNGLIEFSRLDPERGGGHHLVYLPHYLTHDHPRFSASDDELLEEFVAALPLLREGAGRHVIRAFHVFRSRYAQAVCEVGFRHRVPPHATPLPGLFLLDSTQLYPSDRVLSGTVGLARAVAGLVGARRRPSRGEERG